MTVCRYVIAGRVQGVGYRWFVRERCRALPVAGYVRNLESGQVEVVARGSSDALEQLEAILRHGPSAANVTKVEKSEISDQLPPGNPFEIVR